jgi:hypothetical protein
MSYRVAVIALLVLAGCGSPVGPTRTFPLDGRVIDDAQAPVLGAIVAITDGPRTGTQAITGVDGGYNLGQVPAGRVALRISATGYRAYSAELTLSCPTHSVFYLSRP